jgi:hypothetical protein
MCGSCVVDNSELFIACVVGLFQPVFLLCEKGSSSQVSTLVVEQFQTVWYLCFTVRFQIDQYLCS